MSLGPREVRGGADVDPVGGDRPGRDDLVALEAGLEREEVVTAWPITSEWIDVGTPTDLARAKGHS